MQHFFVTPFQVVDGIIQIQGTDVNHMKNVLRMRPGERLTVSDGNNRIYLCSIERYDETAAVLSIVKEETADVELPSKLYLFQGLPKQDKMEMIVQKAVELGVHEIIPVTTKRSIVKLDEKKAADRVRRWQSISQSASKQAGRGYIPEVVPVMAYRQALIYSRDLDVRLIPYELAEDMAETKQIIASIRPGQSIGIFIGPEGGFEKEEIEMAVNEGAQAVTLGRRILRTETAGLATLSVLMFHLER